VPLPVEHPPGLTGGETQGEALLRALDDLLRTAGLDAPAKDAIRHLMGGPERHYHGLRHLDLLWSRHRRFSPGTAFASPVASRLVACAIAFHDAVLEPARNDNEARSAALWRDSAPAGLTAAQVDWVAGTIEASGDHLAVTDASTELARLRLWMLDLDLTPLGEPAAVFDRNTQALRLECAHLTDAEWERRRIGFLRHVQAAPRIYRSAPLAAAFERQARSNIERALRTAG
jgi:predicted metal-dependent HD superfamily phosphohydrolase